MKVIKKIFYLLSVFCLCLILPGCEYGNFVETATFTNATSVGSEDYTFKVNFLKDERVDNKYYDIQIKADGKKSIRIGKEYDERKKIELTENWNSLTTLLLEKEDTETFVKGSDAVAQIYIFNTDEKVKLTLRVVVGGIEDNSQDTGKILTSPEQCSKEFSIETK